MYDSSDKTYYTPYWSRCDGAPNPQRMNEYAALVKIATFNATQYEDMLRDANAKHNKQGVGCYEKLIEKFSKTQLEARVEMLKNLQNDMDRLTDTFQKRAESDVEQVKYGASLTGQGMEQFNPDFDFSKQFSDSKCQTLMSNNDFKTRAVEDTKVFVTCFSRTKSSW